MTTPTALGALALLAGCAFSVPCDLHDKRFGFLYGFAAQRQLPKRDDRGILTGSVQIEPPPTEPIIVFVYQTREGRAEVAEAQILAPYGPYGFAFTVPAGLYRLAAFEDDGRDFRYDPSLDRAALYHDGGPIVLMPGHTVDRLYLRLRDDRPQTIDFDVTLTEPSREACCEEARSRRRASGVRHGPS